MDFLEEAKRHLAFAMEAEKETVLLEYAQASGSIALACAVVALVELLRSAAEENSIPTGDTHE